MTYKLIHVTTNIEKYPEYEDETYEYSHLLHLVEPPAEVRGVVINQYPPYDYLPTFLLEDEDTFLLEDEDTSQVVDNFKKTQEPLGTEFNNVLYDNIEDLYEHYVKLETLNFKTSDKEHGRLVLVL
jgi:hypothetical protein